MAGGGAGVQLYSGPVSTDRLQQLPCRHNINIAARTTTVILSKLVHQVHQVIAVFNVLLDNTVSANMKEVGSLRISFNLINKPVRVTQPPP